MTYYLGSTLSKQILRRKRLLNLLLSFLAGLGFGLCSGIEYLVKWLG